MGMTVFQIDEVTEVHVGDGSLGDDGWHLWMTLHRNGECLADLNDLDDRSFAIVPDLKDTTLRAAAQVFATEV